jgi:hypothetical protein
MGGASKSFLNITLFFAILCISLIRASVLSCDDFVYGAGCDFERYPLVRGSRAWRQGIRAVFAFENTSFIDEQIINQFNESYVSFADPSIHTHRGHLRAAMSFVLAHKAVGPTYKWMLGGDDDTLFYPQNLIRILSHLNHSMPYFISDDIWFASLSDSRSETPFSDGYYNFFHSNPYAPRCLPCTHPHCRETTTYRFLPLKCGCPCTPKQACFAETVPPYHDKPRLCETNKNLRAVVHGGSGSILSIGLLQALNHTEFERCARGQGQSESDAALSVCLWQQNFSITALGPAHTFFGARFVGKQCSDIHCKRHLHGMISTHLGARGYKNLSEAATAMTAIYSDFYQAWNHSNYFHEV